MKKMTIRLEDYVYDRLFLFSKEEEISINKIVGLILKKEIDKPKEINALDSINNRLEEIQNKLTNISKRQQFHFKLSLQHFVNQGYVGNADPKKDKCYQEMKENNIDKFNE